MTQNITKELENQYYVEWNINLINNHGEMETVSVWASSRIEAENDALFGSTIKNATIYDSVLTDDVKRIFKEVNYGTSDIKN